VLIRRQITTMLVLLAAMLAGSALAPSAFAEAGPFWHHRAGEIGEGEKIEAKAPESFRGSGGEQLFRANVGGSTVEIAAASLQEKGAIFNGPDQGQIKAELVYNQPRLISPALSNCNARIGERNIVVAKGFLTWKWNGSKEQLESKPQSASQTVSGIFSAQPPPAESVSETVNLTNNGVLTTITLSGSGCGVLGGVNNVSGSYVGIANRGLNKIFKTVSISVIEPPKTEGFFLQHYWDGKQMQGAKVGLTLGGSPVFYFLGKSTIESGQQEVAVFEK
jgi:hypothetical protein